MGQDAGVIAVDWGTTNRRVYVLGPDGEIRLRESDEMGISSVAANAFDVEVSLLRERHGHAPLILAGMVGSNRGWVEVPYVPCPADLTALVDGTIRLGDGGIAIVPGAAYQDGSRADVMRGEEVQLIGAARGGLIDPDALVCHPGTHAKWAVMRGSAIQSFRTVMTGEMFALLRRHSILSDLLQGTVSVGPAFLAGVRHGLDHDDLLAELFSIRARVLLDRLNPADAASFGSGLLIGNDVRIGLATAPGDGEVAVVGDPDLTTLYAAALAELGRPHCEVDGEAAFLAGIKLLTEALR